MINIRRIKWMYDNFGMGMAIRSAAIDLVELLIFICYFLMLFIRFIYLLLKKILVLKLNFVKLEALKQKVKMNQLIDLLTGFMHIIMTLKT